jgi:hypothetical protein
VRNAGWHASRIEKVENYGIEKRTLGNETFVRGVSTASRP